MRAPTKDTQGVLKAIADYTQPFDEFVMTAEEFTDAGGKVLVRVHQQAVGAESGVPVEADVWFVYTVSGGAITRLDMFSGEPEALEAAGLSE
jgi:ketosteroid isomerase-like protein